MVIMTRLTHHVNSPPSLDAQLKAHWIISSPTVMIVGEKVKPSDLDDFK